MPNVPILESLAFASSGPGEIGETRPMASWPLALALLGFTVALIAAAAAYPNFFAVALDQLGAAAP